MWVRIAVGACLLECCCDLYTSREKPMHMSQIANIFFGEKPLESMAAFSGGSGFS